MHLCSRDREEVRQRAKMKVVTLADMWPRMSHLGGQRRRLAR